MKQLLSPVSLLSGIAFLLFTGAGWKSPKPQQSMLKTPELRIDTLAHHAAGPGVAYTHIRLPDLSVSAYLLSIDLNNRFNRIETFQAQHQVGQTEAMTALSQKHPGAIGAINGNFWIVSGQNQPKELLGVPHSGSIRNGMMITDPNQWNRGRTTDSLGLLNEIGFAVVDQHKKVWVDDMSFEGKVTIKNLGSYPISQVNRVRKTDELVVFNDYMGTQATRSDDAGVEVFIKPLKTGLWTTHRPVRCKVLKVIRNKGGNAIAAGETVLSGSGKAAAFLTQLSEGQTIELSMSISTLEQRQRLQVEQMITGNALVMKNGELTIRNSNEAYNSMLYPRTGVGVSRDHKRAFLIVIDRGKESKGASTATMCQILKIAGAWNATSLDGGGSAQMVLHGAIVNKPSDGKERPVANGWIISQNAPPDQRITRLEFADYNPRLKPNETYKPLILGYNKYNVLVDADVHGFDLQCDATAGSTSSDTVIAKGKAGTCTLTASFDGVSVSKRIVVLP